MDTPTSPPRKKSKLELCEQYAAAMKVRTEAQIRELFPTHAELVKFWDDTKHLCWPEFYAQTPWEFASNVASFARGDGCVTNKFCFEMESYPIAMAYRREAGLSTTRDERGYFTA